MTKTVWKNIKAELALCDCRWREKLNGKNVNIRGNGKPRQTVTILDGVKIENYQKQSQEKSNYS
jgi:hypothetical protein